MNSRPYTAAAYISSN